MTDDDDPILKQAQKQRIGKLISDMRDLIPCISDEERIEVLNDIMIGYCKNCGRIDEMDNCQCVFYGDELFD